MYIYIYIYIHIDLFIYRFIYLHTHINCIHASSVAVHRCCALPCDRLPRPVCRSAGFRPATRPSEVLYIYIYIYIYICVNVCVLYTYIYIYIYTHICITSTYIYIYIYIHNYIYGRSICSTGLLICSTVLQRQGAKMTSRNSISYNNIT